MDRISNARMLSNPTGVRGWNGSRSIRGRSFDKACDGSVEDAVSSQSDSMPELAICANVWANVRRRTTDTVEVDSISSGCGMRANMVAIAKLSGERGRYSKMGSSDGESEKDPTPSSGRSGAAGVTLGGRMGK